MRSAASAALALERLPRELARARCAAASSRARLAELGALELGERLPRAARVARRREHAHDARGDRRADLGVGVLVHAQLAEHRDALAARARLGRRAS